MANLTDYGKPHNAKRILRDAISNQQPIVLKQFGYNSNLGGETLIFQIGENDTLEVSPFWLEDENCQLEELSETDEYQGVGAD